MQEDIAALAATRIGVSEGVDALASSETALGMAAYLSARSEDLRKALAASYQELAQEKAKMAELQHNAARARARADVLGRLSREADRD